MVLRPALARIDDFALVAVMGNVHRYGVALLLLVVWLVVYARVSAPINRQLTGAADEGRPLPNGRALQANWDRVIVARATLQGLAVAALCVVLAI